ncbi:hypothetical protein L1887_32562 [Cichorium endivia]|nr:hypothetical protein L1887_32562 [Cichorium endivia]
MVPCRCRCPIYPLDLNPTITAARPLLSSQIYAPPNSLSPPSSPQPSLAGDTRKRNPKDDDDHLLTFTFQSIKGNFYQSRYFILFSKQ